MSWPSFLSPSSLYDPSAVGYDPYNLTTHWSVLRKAVLIPHVLYGSNVFFSCKGVFSSEYRGWLCCLLLTSPMSSSLLLFSDSLLHISSQQGALLQASPNPPARWRKRPRRSLSVQGWPSWGSGASTCSPSTSTTSWF